MAVNPMEGLEDLDAGQATNRINGWDKIELADVSSTDHTVSVVKNCKCLEVDVAGQIKFDTVNSAGVYRQMLVGVNPIKNVTKIYASGTSCTAFDNAGAQKAGVRLCR